jgi:hypothetical protein
MNNLAGAKVKPASEVLDSRNLILKIMVQANQVTSRVTRIRVTQSQEIKSTYDGRHGLFHQMHQLRRQE